MTAGLFYAIATGALALIVALEVRKRRRWARGRLTAYEVARRIDGRHVAEPGELRPYALSLAVVAVVAALAAMVR